MSYHVQPKDEPVSQTGSDLGRKRIDKGAPKVVLSCELCRQRKARCDKLNPCTNCKRAGVKCRPVERSRLPRGRSGAKRAQNTELKARISRLETLISHRDEEGSVDSKAINQPATSSGGFVGQISDPQSEAECRRLDRFVGGSFWSSLTEEIDEIRDILEDSSSDEEAEAPPTNEPSNAPKITDPSDFNFVLYNLNALKIDPGIFSHPPTSMKHDLCNIYLTVVDSVVKTSHEPSIRKLLQHDQPYLDYPRGHPAVEALTFAVYYAAICTQTEESSKQRFGQSREVIRARYKLATEVCLARVEFMNTTDITVLQSLFLYLLANRTDDRSRSTWTLCSLLVRIARVIGLHRESSSSNMTTFDREMRRRLWYMILLLDVQTAADRSSELATPQDGLELPLPKNINDSDIHLGYDGPLQDREEFTDMSTALVSAEAALFVACLDLGVVPTLIKNTDKLTTWEGRRNHTLEFHEKIQRNYLRHCDPQYPLQWFTLVVGRGVTAEGYLMAVRPLHPVYLRESPNVNGTDILKMALEVLDWAHAAFNDAKAGPFRWIGEMYVQWRPLAIVLAELCVQLEGPLVERAWRIALLSYDVAAKNVADTHKGLLWRPIEKLMRKARQSTRVDLAAVEGAMESQNVTSKEVLGTQHNDIPAPKAEVDEFCTLDVTTGFTPFPGQDDILNSQFGFMPWSLGPEVGGITASAGSQEDPNGAWANWGDFVHDLYADDRMDIDRTNTLHHIRSSPSHLVPH